MSIASIVGQRAIRLGATGNTVKAIQLALADMGYPLNGTGYFGPATDTAVSSFQKLAGLKADGVVGSATAAALDKLKTGHTGIPVTPLAEIARPLWVEAGIKLIGTKEAPGARDNQTIIDWAKEEGGDIAKAYTHDSVPWCALFVDHILTLGGQKGTGTLWALDYAGNWHADKLAGPAVGAIAPMVRSGGGHVICIVGRDQHGNVMGLGGNQSDQVSIIPFPLSRLNKGFWWPAGAQLPAKTGMGSLPLINSNGKVSLKEA